MDEREKVVGAIREGRVSFAPGVEEKLGTIDFVNPDYTITSVQLSCWGKGEGRLPGFCVYWTTKSAGFGSTCVSLEDGKIKCENEGMGPSFLKPVFSHLVQQMELADK